MVSGNVSLYNETQGRPIYPTPIVGALGLLEDVTRHATSGFRAPGDTVFLLGRAEVRGRAADLAGSEYLETVHGVVAGKPRISLRLERRVQQVCRRAVAEGVVASAHDCSDGGLAVALAESCMASGVGFHGVFPVSGRWDAALFGESQSRIVLSTPPDRGGLLVRMAEEADVPLTELGRVSSGGRFCINGLLDVGLDYISRAWRGALGGL